jgi:hypothetical protein
MEDVSHDFILKLKKKKLLLRGAMTRPRYLAKIQRASTRGKQAASTSLR